MLKRSNIYLCGKYSPKLISVPKSVQKQFLFLGFAHKDLSKEKTIHASTGRDITDPFIDGYRRKGPGQNVTLPITLVLLDLTSFDWLKFCD